jgi:hypothetical protein
VERMKKRPKKEKPKNKIFIQEKVSKSAKNSFKREKAKLNA